MVDAELPDLSGKLVAFYLSSAPPAIKSGVILEDPEFRRFGERLFVNRARSRKFGLERRFADCRGLGLCNSLPYL